MIGSSRDGMSSIFIMWVRPGLSLHRTWNDEKEWRAAKSRKKCYNQSPGSEVSVHFPRCVVPSLTESNQGRPQR